jgi:hypothetical protein
MSRTERQQKKKKKILVVGAGAAGEFPTPLSVWRFALCGVTTITMDQTNIPTSKNAFKHIHEADVVVPAYLAPRHVMRRFTI